MATKKKAKESNGRASVSRERRLALALRALLDALDDVSIGADGNRPEMVADAEGNAESALTVLGYGSLVGIPRRLKELNEQLTTAVAAGDGATIARIGAEMVKVQAGKPSKSTAPPATKKSSRSNGGKSSIASTETQPDAAIGANAGGE